jgi:hypothetical protein
MFTATAAIVNEDNGTYSQQLIQHWTGRTCCWCSLYPPVFRIPWRLANRRS